jgi:probable phosphoglycerate mutase
MRKAAPMVIFARHGQTALNSKAAGSAERIRGWTDVPLNTQGHREADQLAGELKNYPITDIISSDLSRAAHTAAAIAKPHSLPVMHTKTLRPWNLGNFTGQNVKDVTNDINKFVVSPNKTVPDGESFNSFKERYLPILRLAMDYAQNKGRTVALVSHTRNAQLTKAWMAAGADPDYDISTKVMNDYSDQTHTADHFLLIPSDDGWQLHMLNKSHPTTYEEFASNGRQGLTV